MTASELADRRKRILKMAAAGKTSGEIAKELGITPMRARHSLQRARMHASGVERFGEAPPLVHNILRRAGFNNRAEVVEAVKSGRIAALRMRGMGEATRAFILKEFSK